MLLQFAEAWDDFYSLECVVEVQPKAMSTGRNLLPVLSEVDRQVSEYRD
jgi:hypothetical protein